MARFYTNGNISVSTTTYVTHEQVLYINSTHNFYTIIAQPDSFSGGWYAKFFIINLTKNLIDMFINTDQMLLLLKGRFDHLVRLMMKNFQA